MATLRFRNSLLAIAVAAGELFGQTGGVQTPGGTPGTGQPSAPIYLFGPGTLAAGDAQNVYVAVRDGIFKIDRSGVRTRVAGVERNLHFSGDGPAARAGINASAVAIDTAGNLYIADAGNHRVRKLAAATGVLTTIAGDGVRGFSGDGGPATSAHLDGPTGVAVDAIGNLYIADGTADGNIRIRRVAAADGAITTVAGNGSQGDSGDGGAAPRAQFRTLGGLATDASGNLYIADNFNNRIRMVSAATGIVTTVAGNGGAGLSGDGGLARNAELNNPLGVAVDAAGNVFIADSGNFRIRKVNAATGTISTVGNGGVVYRDTQHGFPCALAFDAASDLYIADSGVARVRRVPAESTGADAPFTPVVQSFTSGSGFKINVTYDPSVSGTAQAAFNSVISTYESIFTSNVTVNLYVLFGPTGLAESLTEQQDFSYSTWRAAMIANATANPGNTYTAAAAASLPSGDPIGNGNVLLNTAYARALGLNASTNIDSSITFSNSAAFEYTGVAAPGASDFRDAAAHELDEALGIGSALTGLQNNAPIPTGNYAAEDYFRYAAAGVRDITTNPNAVVYFSYNGGSANVAQFNQSYSAQGDTNLDRNDWIYGNFGCPSATLYVQDAIACEGQAVAIGSGPEITVLSALGYDSSLSQTITFPAISNVTFGVAPFAISATANSGLAVSFTSTQLAICTVSGSTVTVVAAGTCSITANQPGNAIYSAAPAVSRSFTVSQAAQTITFGALPNVKFGVAPFTIGATATSGLAVTLASTTTPVCTVSGSTVTIVGTGTCSITASQTGNTNYLAATPVIQSFTVNAGVAAPTLVSPANGMTGVALTPTLAWNASGGAASYNIYFGTSPVPPLVNNVAGTNFSPGTLVAGQTYYWQVVAMSSGGISASPIWSFTTQSEACPYQLGSSAVTVSAGARNDSVTVTAPLGCPWTAVSTANWIGITAGTGNGNGTATYTVTANSGGYRSTDLGIAGQGLAVNQLAQRLANITDFDGDGKADLAIYRPSTGTWSALPSSTGGPSITASWGLPGDISVVGDFDGDKVLDFAVYRPGNGTWYIIPSSTGVPYTVGWGLPGDVPVPADYDGDGKTDLAVWRPSNQTWYVIPSSDPSVPIVKTWGIAGDQPVQGDFDGDGKKDFAVYRPSTGAWYIIPSSTGVAYGVAWGIPGDEPVPGDFDGDGKTDLAIYRSSTGTWYVILSSNGIPMSQNWGLAGDQPVLLDYDGDHRADFSVYRPSNQTWYVIQSSNGTVAQQQYGIPNDIPLYRPWPWQ